MKDYTREIFRAAIFGCDEFGTFPAKLTEQITNLVAKVERETAKRCAEIAYSEHRNQTIPEYKLEALAIHDLIQREFGL